MHTSNIIWRNSADAQKGFIGYSSKNDLYIKSQQGGLNIGGNNGGFAPTIAIKAGTNFVGIGNLDSTSDPTHNLHVKGTFLVEDSGRIPLLSGSGLNYDSARFNDLHADSAHFNTLTANNITFSGEPSMCTQYQNSNLGKYEPNLDKAIIDADVVMALRIQHERFETDTSLNLDEYKQSFGLTSERLDLARGDVILMHPGPVNFIEISENVYNLDNTVIRDQVANGVAIRMAVLSRFLSS